MRYIAVLLAVVLLLSSCINPTPTPSPVVSAPGAGITSAVVAVKQGGTGTSSWTAGAIPFVAATNSSRMSEVSTATTGAVIKWNGTAPVYSNVWSGATVPFTELQLARGETVITAASVTASVTHTLGAVPSQVLLSWKNAAPVPVSAGSSTFLFSSVYTSIGFTVNISHALSNAPTIAWLAIP